MRWRSTSGAIACTSPGETKSRPLQPGVRAGAAVERDPRPRAGAELDLPAEVFGILRRRAGRVHEVDDEGLDRIGHMQRRDLAPGGEDVLDGDRGGFLRRWRAGDSRGLGRQRRLFLGPQQAQDAELVVRGGIVHQHLHQEAVGLGLGQADRCPPARSGSAWP